LDQREPSGVDVVANEGDGPAVLEHCREYGFGEASHWPLADRLQ